MRRSQFDQPSEYISAKLTMIPRIGTAGTQGVRNGRGWAGCLIRITHTPAQTITKANKVPMLVMRPTMLSGSRAEKGATRQQKSRLERQGVWYLGWMSEKTRGSRPS